MTQPTEQVKNAIAALKQAGFSRSEFKVNVKRLWRNVDGKRFYEYGDAEISLRAPSEKAHRLIPEMLAAGLNITVLRYEKNGEIVRAYPIIDNNWPHGQYNEVMVK